MKSTIKILAVFAMVLGLATVSKAQNTANKDIKARAAVSAAVTVTNVDNLSFGAVTPGVAKTIGTENNLIAGTAGSSALIVGDESEKTGKFTVTKGVNTQVILAFTLINKLTLSGGGDLTINFSDAGAEKLAKLSNGTSADDVKFTPASGITTAQTGSTSKYFTASTFDVFIGGTVVPTNAQAAGLYEGDIKLTATYN